MQYAQGFHPKNLRVLGPKKEGDNSNLICIYENEFKGKDYIHIREVWRDKHGFWHPGKGTNFETGCKAEIINCLKQI